MKVLTYMDKKGNVHKYLEDFSDRHSQEVLCLMMNEGQE